MLQSFMDKFPMCFLEGRAVNMPAILGDHLTKGDVGMHISGTIPSLTIGQGRACGPEIQNSVCKLSKYMSGVELVHYKATCSKS
jgi:hypothetical protein